MHSVDFGGKQTVNYASCIEEMSQLEFEYFMLLYAQQQSDIITIEDFRKMLTFKLLDIRKTAKYYNMPQLLRDIIHDHVNRVVETIDSFYIHEAVDGKLVHRLDLSWIKQMLPVIDGLHGPADALTSCTFFEHKEAFSRYCSYLDTQDEDMLNEMIAILYRPRPFAYRLRRFLSKYDVPERTIFNSKTNSAKLAKRKAKVSKWPDHIKLGISQWYSNCLQFLRSGTPVIDGVEIDFSILFPKNTDENTGPAGIGLMGIIFSLAETHVFGDSEKTGNSNLYDVLARLYQLQLEYNAMKAKEKQNDKG